jgi:hypothetical protein
VRHSAMRGASFNTGKRILTRSELGASHVTMRLRFVLEPNEEFLQSRGIYAPARS